MREVGFFGITPGACRIGSACRDSFRASRRIPMGQTSNAPLEDRLLDPWRCVVRRLFRAMDELNRQRRLSSDSPWSVFSTKRLALFRRSRLRHGVGSRQRGDRFSTLRARCISTLSRQRLCLGRSHVPVVRMLSLVGRSRNYRCGNYDWHPVDAFLQRSDALWPVALAHYLIDVIDFA